MARPPASQISSCLVGETYKSCTSYLYKEGDVGFIGPLPESDEDRAAAAATHERHMRALRSLPFTPWWPDGTTTVLSPDQVQEHHHVWKRFQAEVVMNDELDADYRDRLKTEYHFNHLRAMYPWESQAYARALGYETTDLQ